LREVVELIRKTPYSGIVEGLEREQVGIPTSVRLERGLERIILDRARVKGSSDPLGVGLMIVYLWQKYHEVGNIRIILRAKTYDMYPEDVRSLLVM
jgi:vacuolar-type H+-ATPase subunit C/Vma6